MDKSPITLFVAGALTLGGCKPQPVPREVGSLPATPVTALRAGASPRPPVKPAQVATRVREIVAEQLGIAPERVSLLSTWKELGADSLDSVELIMAFEEEFDLEIPDAQAEAMKTVGEAVAYLRLHRKP